MTRLTIGSYSDCGMRWISGAIIIGQVAAYAGIWWVAVVTVLAFIAVSNCSMGPCKRIVVIMNGKGCG